jgi:hypothetical protein
MHWRAWSIDLRASCAKMHPGSRIADREQHVDFASKAVGNLSQETRGEGEPLGRQVVEGLQVESVPSLADLDGGLAKVFVG